MSDDSDGEAERDAFAAFNDSMNDDADETIAAEEGEESTIDSVEAVDEETVRITTHVGAKPVTRDLSPEESQEYRDAYGVRRVQSFEGERVLVLVDNDTGERRIVRPIADR